MLAKEDDEEISVVDRALDVTGDMSTMRQVLFEAPATDAMYLQRSFQVERGAVVFCGVGNENLSHLLMDTGHFVKLHPLIGLTSIDQALMNQQLMERERPEIITFKL